MTNKYWLGILPHVYYVQKNNKALLYNTQTGEHIHTQNIQVINLLEQMHDRKNLGVICVDEITAFIRESVSKNICSITEITDDRLKPIQLMPVLNLQRDIEKLKQEEGRSLGEDVLHYLSDVTIYINRLCRLNCRHCKDYHHQFFHCSKSLDTENIDLNLLQQFLKQLAFTFIRRLAITGGNIFLYPYFSELITFLQKERIRPLFGIHCGDIDKDKIILLNDFPKEIFVTFPIEKNYIENIAFLSKQDNTKIIFEISSVETHQQAESLIAEYAIENYDYKPFYNDENQIFFEKNVYLTKEDIFNNPIPQRIIFARQKLNTNFFGSLTLMPNGKIYANVNRQELGNIETDSLLDLIHKEMNDNTAWRHTRNEAPCSDCLYQYLCPSPTNYEQAIGRPNLCHCVPKEQ